MDLRLNPDYIRAIGNPAKRYRAARNAEGAIKRELAMIARNAVAEMLESGMHAIAVGRELGISHQRVAQLRREPHYEPSAGDKPLGRPKRTPPPTEPKPRRSRRKAPPTGDAA